jgi:hypothetical protein
MQSVKKYSERDIARIIVLSIIATVLILDGSLRLYNFWSLKSFLAWNSITDNSIVPSLGSLAEVISSIAFLLWALYADGMQRSCEDILDSLKLRN